MWVGQFIETQRVTFGACGAHSLLCRYEDGTPTELSNEAVKQALTILKHREMHIAVNAPELNIRGLDCRSEASVAVHVSA